MTFFLALDFQYYALERVVSYSVKGGEVLATIAVGDQTEFVRARWSHFNNALFSSCSFIPAQAGCYVIDRVKMADGSYASSKRALLGWFTIEGETRPISSYYSWNDQSEDWPGVLFPDGHVEDALNTWATLSGYENWLNSN